MQILSAAEMAATDLRTASEFGVSLETLMENAGSAVARFCLQEHPAAKKIVVLAGKGNNGGDGLVAARVLAERGRQVEVFLLGCADELKGEAATAFARLRRESSGTPVHEIRAATEA